jgi:hypothetical protein
VRWKLDGVFVRQFDRGVVGHDRRYGVDESGAWRGRPDGKLSLLVVDVCKIEGFPMNVTEGDGRVV